MAKSKKLVIRVDKEELSPYEFEGTIGQLIEYLQGKLKTYGPDAKLNWNSDYWAAYADTPSPRYEIYVDRDETDEEQRIRIEKELAHKAAVEAKERAEFERLQKKFNK